MSISNRQIIGPVSHIPARHSEKSFRQYERIIADVVRGWPTRVFIDPTKMGYAAETIAHRLREAKKSYAKYNWDTTMIDREKFESLDTIFTVGVDEATNQVWAGPPQPRQYRTATVQGEPAMTNEVVTINLDGASDPLDVINTLCFLASKNALSKRIRIPQLLNITVEELEATYDVAITQQDDGSFILR